jgi:cellulose synthase/poly-beta-1,6-N-acetylglucosamine synthase-like glycosyltransferase
MDGLLLLLYWTAVGGLLLYGLNAYVLCFAWLRNDTSSRRRQAALREAFRVADEALPVVTVQLPIYNERYVVDRLIRAVCALDYPRDRLEIQVLDDSTDDTSERTARLVEQFASSGLDIRHIRRADRAGFKAGALAAGMRTARGELLAIFDADFVPEPDFLERTIPLFQGDDVGTVQCRWGHLDRDHNLLTRAQGLAIDGHFGIEQAGRCGAGYLLNFNGTAGVWRRAAIDDAGGWTADTLTEDLDLSYRAQLRGWRIEYLLDTVVPAEIPADLLAFKSQQRRWAKGSIQTARLQLGNVWRSALPAWVKLQALMHLTHYLVHPLMLAVALLAVLALMLGTGGPSTLYLTSQRALGRPLLETLKTLPLLMVIGTGIAVSNTRAVLEALLGIPSPFVRTPKRRVTAESQGTTRGYRLGLDPVFVIELAMAAWSAYGLLVYLERGRWLVGPFLALYALGFGFVAVRSIWETLCASRGLSEAIPGEAPGQLSGQLPGQLPGQLGDSA